MIVAGAEQLEELREEVLRRLDAELLTHASQLGWLSDELVVALFQEERDFLRHRERLETIVHEGAFVLVGFPGAPRVLRGASAGVDISGLSEVAEAIVLVTLGTEVVCALVAAAEPALQGYVTRLSFSAPLAASAAAQLLHVLRPRLSPGVARQVRSALDAAILAPRPDASTTGQLEGVARVLLAS